MLRGRFNTTYVFAALLAVLFLCTASLPTVRGDGFSTKIEPGERECFTEVLDAGTTLAFTFMVTDGGSFDIDVTMTAVTTPNAVSVGEVDRFHYLAAAAGHRDRKRERVVHRWERATEGSQSYTAPPVEITKHGLPAEVSVCFDNGFTTVYPKWVRFSFLKQEALEVDPDAINTVESQMEELLHRFSTALFELAQDTDRLFFSSKSDRTKADAIVKIIGIGLLCNIFVVVVMASYAFFSLSRFLARLSQRPAPQPAVNPKSV